MGAITWLWALPLATACAIVAAPGSRAGVSRWIALTGSSVHLGLVAWVLARHAALGAPARPQLEERAAWFSSMGIGYVVAIDGISLLMVALTSIVVWCGVLASWEVRERTKEFFALLLLLATGVFGVFVAFDLFLLFVFYEIAVLPMYLLIGVWGTGRKEYAAMKLTLMLMVGSALVLVAMIALWHAGGHTFDLERLAAVRFPIAFQRWVFPVVFIGFGVLGALFPFHTWSPDGHASAPTAVSMLHAGVLMKLGGYGALRIGVGLLPEGAAEWGPLFVAVCTLNIVWGAWAAIQQRDLKYFTAYSSVSHCGFVLFGVAALDLVSVKGAVLQMFAHGVMTGLFFALIGMVYGRTHTRMIPELGGLARPLPWFAACFYLGGMASLGLPGLAGFVAEAHVFVGGFIGADVAPSGLQRALTLVATTSIVVTAVYVLRGLGAAFHGPLGRADYAGLARATLPERVSTGTLAAVLVVVGVAPAPVIDLIEPPLQAIVARVRSRAPAAPVEAASAPHRALAPVVEAP